jgi:hypothetical protein
LPCAAAPPLVLFLLAVELRPFLPVGSEVGSRGILRSASLVAWRLLRSLAAELDRGSVGGTQWSRGSGAPNPWARGFLRARDVGGTYRGVFHWTGRAVRGPVGQASPVTWWHVGSPSKWLEPLGISGDFWENRKFEILVFFLWSNKLEILCLVRAGRLGTCEW